MLNGVMVSTNVFGTFSLGSSPGSTTKYFSLVIYRYIQLNTIKNYGIC